MQITAWCNYKSEIGLETNLHPKLVSNSGPERLQTYLQLKHRRTFSLLYFFKNFYAMTLDFALSVDC